MQTSRKASANERKCQGEHMANQANRLKANGKAMRIMEATNEHQLATTHKQVETNESR